MKVFPKMLIFSAKIERIPPTSVRMNPPLTFWKLGFKIFGMLEGKSEDTEKKDLFGMSGISNEGIERLRPEDRERLTGEERLKVTVSMPLWLKIYIWKESLGKGIPVWQYLARIIQENEVLRKENEVLRKESEVLRRENEELKNENEVLRKVSGSDYSVIKYEKLKEYIRKILKDMIEYCGECARGVLLKYKALRIVGVEEMIDEVLK